MGKRISVDKILLECSTVLVLHGSWLIDNVRYREFPLIAALLIDECDGGVCLSIDGSIDGLIADDLI